MPRGWTADQATMAQALAREGMDTRVWVAYGVIDDPTDNEGEQSVVFDKDDGQIYVNVTLKPWDMPCRCRLGMLQAGPGEGSFFPVVARTEVLVVLPEGRPDAGGVIICQLANAFDTVPMDSVAGADPTKNSFGAIRSKAALTVESGATLMMRSAAAGAFLRLDAKGNITLRDGFKNVLQMSADTFGWQNGDGDAYLQLDLNDKRFNYALGQVNLVLSGGGGSTTLSYLQTPGPMTIAAGGGVDINSAVEHVLTTEALFNILTNVFAQIAVVTPGPLTGASLTAAYVSAAPLSIPLAAQSPQLPPIAAALAAAFSSALPKPPGVPGQGQTLPALGCAGLKAGLRSRDGYASAPRCAAPSAG